MGPRRYNAATESTQRDAIAWAREAAPHGSRVVAGRQEAGIGRVHHRWVSPEGGLYLSVITRGPKVRPSLLPLSVGVFLRRMLEKNYGVAPEIKWPNDLLVTHGGASTRKLAGILVDRVTATSGRSSVVVGIGVNVSAPPEAFPEELRGTVVGLAELCRTPVDLRELEESVASSVEEAVRSLDREDGPRRVVSACREALHGLGRFAFVDGRPAGLVRGVAEDGALCVESDGRIEWVTAGSLRLEGLA